MNEMTMTRSALRAWAEDHADGPVATGPDRRHSLTSRLVRFRWNGDLTVAVGSDADGKTRINAVLDALALFLGQAEPASATVHLIVGAGPDGAQDPSIQEHLGAIGTLVAALAGGPTVRVWTLSPGTAPVEVPCATAEFTTGTPARWTKLLMAAATTSVTGMAALVADALTSRPSFSLYPKLSSLRSTYPWQMRLDGLEIGRAGPVGATLGLSSKDVTKPNEPSTHSRRTSSVDVLRSTPQTAACAHLFHFARACSPPHSSRRSGAT